MPGWWWLGRIAQDVKRAASAFVVDRRICGTLGGKMLKRATLAAVLCNVAALTAAVPALAGPSVLFDAKTGAVLYSEDAGQAWHPASLTKLMTAYLTFQALKSGALKPEDQLTCNEAAFKAAPSKVGLKIGQQISADLALRALVIKSANDMAILLAEKIGGSEAGFVAMMNQTAQRLGMKSTSFVNPNGLPDPGQITTARDLGLLAQALIRDFPEHADLFATPTLTIGKAKLSSHNRLLKTFQGADGMKTGFICDSGYNIVATATRNGVRLVAVVLGGTSSASRNVRTAALLEYGFQNYPWKAALSKSTIQTVAAAPTDTTIPMNIRTQVMNWSCGWRPPKALVAATDADGEEQAPGAAQAAAKDAPKEPAKAAAKVAAKGAKKVKAPAAKGKPVSGVATPTPLETATTAPVPPGKPKKLPDPKIGTTVAKP
jgi:D-alanyl-D-alanine carboxypeptidase